MLLLGDASYDPRNFIGTSQPAPLPALWTKTSYLWTASDPLLAAVNGDDALPDLAIGRLPAATVEQAQALVAKLLAWEDSGQGLDGAAALVADNPDGAGDFDADVDDIRAELLPGRARRGSLKLTELGPRPATVDPRRASTRASATWVTSATAVRLSGRARTSGTPSTPRACRPSRSSRCSSR